MFLLSYLYFLEAIMNESKNILFLTLYRSRGPYRSHQNPCLLRLSHFEIRKNENGYANTHNYATFYKKRAPKSFSSKSVR